MVTCVIFVIQKRRETIYEKPQSFAVDFYSASRDIMKEGFSKFFFASQIRSESKCLLLCSTSHYAGIHVVKI